MDPTVFFGALAAFFAVLTGLFLYGSMHYRRRMLQEEDDKKGYRDLFMLLRDRGIDYVASTANLHYNERYLEEIRKIDEHVRAYKGDEPPVDKEDKRSTEN